MFIDNLKKQSDNFNEERKSVINEITESFKNYCNEKLKNFLEKNIGADEIQKRAYTLYGEYWEYHEGCSGTHFYLAGWTWKNPDADEYSYASTTYKKVSLLDIQSELLGDCVHYLREKLESLGFRNVDYNKEYNRLGYIKYKIVLHW